MNILQRIVMTFREIIDPLVRAAGDAKAREAILQLMELPPTVAGTAPAINPQVVDRIDAYVRSTDPDLQAFLEVADDLLALATSVRGFVDAAVVGGLPGVGDEGLRLLASGLTLNWLRRRSPVVYSVLRSTQIIESELVDHYRETLLVERVGQLFSDIGSYFETLYGPLQTDADAQRWSDGIFVPLTGAVVAIEKILTGGHTTPLRPFYRWDAPADAAHPIADRVLNRTFTMTLSGTFDTGAGTSTETQVNTTAIIVPRDHGGPGLFLGFGGSAAITTPLGRDFNLTIEVASDVAFTLWWIFGQALEADGPTGARFDVEVDRTPTNTTLPLRLKITDTTYFEFGRVRTRLRYLPAARELDLRLEIEGAQLVIGGGSVDSFVRSSAGGGFRIGIDFTGGVSTTRGFYLEGGAGISKAIPVNINLGGVLRVHTVLLELKPSPSGAMTGSAALTLSLRIGPVRATVEGIGIGAEITFPATGANLWLVNLAPDFIAPRGAGISIEAGPVVGGGFLTFDRANGRYAGVIQLRIGEISVSAYGLIDTQVPSGFSMLVIIAVEFPGVPLAFGFTLRGIGGILGIHRTIDTNAIRDGLRAGTLDAILFPQNPAQNAPQIISSLRTVFPPMNDRHIVGLLFKLGYGKPNLLDIELGFLLELPDPFRLVLIGQAGAMLPTKETPLIVLRLDILGIIEFDGPRISLDGSLRDSRVTAFAVWGDFAFRLSGGNAPVFVFSLGGLHPQFPAPAGLPSLRRVTIALGSGSNPRVSLQAYLALTSNTLQVGALAEVYASAGGFSLYGWVGFDALITFNPFSFVVDFSAGIELRRGSRVYAGIHLHATLSGPSPWNVRGEACLSLFFFDICVPVNATIGSGHPQGAISMQVWPLLQSAVADPANWSAALDAGSDRSVSLHALEGETLIPPAGALAFRQRLVPLDRTIDKFGESVPDGPRNFTVTAVRIDRDARPWETLEDFFAPAHFKSLTDAEKLSRPSFERMHAGVAVSPGEVSHGSAVGTDVMYDTTLIDSPFDSRPGPVYVLPLAVQLAANARAASSVSTLATTGLGKFAPAGPVLPSVTLGEVMYVFVDTRTLQRRTDLAAPMRKGAALDALQEWEQTHADQRGRLQVVALHELEAAA